MHTQEQIEAFAKHYNIDLTDGSQLPGVEASLNAVEAGQGELDAKLFDAVATREVMKPLRQAYFAAKGVEEPAYSESLDQPEHA